MQEFVQNMQRNSVVMYEETTLEINVKILGSSIIIFFHGPTAPVGQSLLIIETSRSHSDTPH
jgi:hypothetical protein